MPGNYDAKKNYILPMHVYEVIHERRRMMATMCAKDEENFAIVKVKARSKLDI